MIIDDQEVNIALLEKLLTRAGYTNVVSITDPRGVVDMFLEVEPDLLLLDLHMPHLDGFQVMTQLEPWIGQSRGNYLPILVLTADVTTEARERALSAGARDFLIKPFDSVEALLRIGNLLQTRFLHLEVKEHNRILDLKVRERTSELWEAIRRLEEAKKDLRGSREETIQRLSIAGEYRDDDTYRHIQRMSHYCAILARKVGWDSDRVEEIRLASQMHDVGKLGTPDGILFKPGPLTEEERTEMQRHASIGYRILADSRAEILQMAASIAYTHHERMDGKGYPRGLVADEIPIEGRIASIADIFDALTTDRVYRKAFPLPKALEIMQEGRGPQLDPELLDLFVASMPEVMASMTAFQDAPGTMLVAVAAS